MRTSPEELCGIPRGFRISQALGLLAGVMAQEMPRTVSLVRGIARGLAHGLAHQEAIPWC